MLKRKSYTRTYTESILGHALVLRRRVLNSSFLLLYFFNLYVLFLSFSFPVCFFSVSLIFSFLCIIYYGLFTISSIHMWIKWWRSFFFCFSCLFLNLPFLAVRLRVHCSGIISTLMRPKSRLGSI